MGGAQARRLGTALFIGGAALLVFTAVGLGAGGDAWAAKRKRTTATPAASAHPAPAPSAHPASPPAPTTRARRHASAAASSSHTPGASHYVREGALPPVVDGATCPAEMALIDGRFCVDKWEASLVEVVGPGEERPWSPYDAIPPGTRVRAVSAPGVTPQAYISGEQAQAACRASSKRLCNPTEWRTACMGPRRMMWGYAASHQRGACNDTARTSPMYHYYPQVKESWTLVGMTEMNDPRLNQLDGTLMRTGESASCTNEYGVYDMVGNVHEWTDDPNGTFQGGWYLDTTVNGDGCGYRTSAHEFKYHDYSTGFRCCADATPGARAEVGDGGAAGAASASPAVSGPVDAGAAVVTTHAE